MGDNQYRRNNKRFDIEVLDRRVLCAPKTDVRRVLWTHQNICELLKTQDIFGNMVMEMSKNVAHFLMLCSYDNLR